MPKKILLKLLNLDLVIAGIALAALILYTFIGVVMRYFINRPITWGEEFQLLCIVIVVFFGAGAGFRTGSHVAIDFIADLFPWKVQRVIVVAMYVISMVIMVYFFLQSSVFVRQMFVTQRVTNMLRIPFFLIYAAFPIGCLLIMVNYTIATWKKYIKPGNEGADE
jgi:TRAP-type C4-dicarboxylate transport system permease small subunit